VGEVSFTGLEALRAFFFFLGRLHGSKTIKRKLGREPEEP
jgi:hypothetical protein